MEYDVFISYSSKDKIAADNIVATLEANKIRCWIAPRDVLPGMDYGEVILKAISDCQLMVLVFSSNSNKSEHVKNEVEAAVSREKPIIPIRVENVLPSGSLALHLSRRQWLDAVTPPLKKHLKRLAVNVQSLLSVPEHIRKKFDESSDSQTKQPLRFYPPEKTKGLVRPLVLITSLLVLTFLILAVYWYFGSRPAVPFSERDWVLITDFENHTGNDVFDKSLSTAITVSIEQSRYVNVLSRQRIRDALQRMKKEDVMHIDETIGREIAEREGINVMVVPSISRVGETYVLTAVIRDIKDMTLTRSEIVSAKSLDEVLNALDKLSKRIRSVLGESFLSISRQNKPLADATTSSLEALKQYTLAHENHRAGNFQDAKLYYENALRVDSTFSMARAGLGMMHIVGTERNLQGFDPSRGKELIEEALQNLDGLTDREKYSILIFHAGTVEGDFEGGAQYCKALLAIYPDYGPAYNNLGWFYERLGRYFEAIDNFKRAILLDPSLLVAYRGICYRYEQLGEIDSSLVWAKRWTAEYPDDANGWTSLGWMYLGKDSLRQAQTTFEKAQEINPHFTLILYNLGHTYRLQGNYREAIKSLQRILEMSPSDSWAHYQLGVLYHLNGDNQTSHRHFEYIKSEVEKWIRQDPEKVYNFYLLGLVLTRMGETQLGWDMGQKALAIDSTQHFVYAQLLTLHGQTQEAIDQLELAVQKGYRNYIAMKTHMDLHPLNNEPEFQKFLEKVLKK